MNRATLSPGQEDFQQLTQEVTRAVEDLLESFETYAAFYDRLNASRLDVADRRLASCSP